MLYSSGRMNAEMDVASSLSVIIEGLSAISFQDRLENLYAGFVGLGQKGWERPLHFPADSDGQMGFPLENAEPIRDVGTWLYRCAGSQDCEWEADP